MQTSSWLITGSIARLALPHLSLAFDSDRPAEGLKDICVRDQSWRSTRLLGVAASALSPTAKLVEWYARGSDLISAYETGEPHAARIDISWHAAAANDGDPWLARVDLLVSLRTDRLDWRHDVYLESDVPGAAVLREPHARRGFQLFQGDQFAYAEFVHPADLREEIDSTSSDFISLRRRLFASESLEKGVILRARARGLFMSADILLETACRCYDEFLAADPPLGG